jgi:predicted ATP-dependent endonuclease of OLD family
MKIVYFWISKVVNMENIEFNLGANYRFTFNANTNMLKAERNQSFIRNFYYLPSIQENININVNAIVGENGTGKTSILEAIRDVILGNYRYDYLYILANNDEYEYCSNLEDINFHGLEIRKKGKRAKGIKQIFYSNVFDSRVLNKSFLNNSNYQDVTTNTLIKISGNVRWYLSSELSDQINFCVKFNNSSLTESLKVPDNILLTLNYIDNINGNLPDILTVYIKRISSQVMTEKIFNNYTNTNTFKTETNGNKMNKQFYYFYLKQLIYYYFSQVNGFIYKNFPTAKTQLLLGGFYTRYYKALDLFINMVDDPNVQVSINKLSEILYNSLSGINGKGKINLDKVEFQGFLNTLDREICILIDLLIEKTIIPANGNSGKTQLTKLSPEAIDIFGKWKEHTLGGLVWTELSSGEYSMMSMFSRIYAAKKRIGVHKNSITLILIDEGELYFHPQWQKDWLYMLLKGLNVIFMDQKEEEIQILLTTHSPFILSDIPNDRVLFLKKSQNDEGINVGNHLLDSPLTWGANIHGLYTNSFFLSDGLMGNFAKEKINELIHKLIHEEPEEIRNSSEIIRNTIDLIGEPILKKKLIELYQQKILLLKPETKVIYDEMQFLRERLNKLEQLAKKQGEF